MLRLRSLHRSNGAYYLMTTLAGGADPNGLVEPDGRWMGSLAQDLAIHGATVDRPGLAAAFRGLDPTDRHLLDPRHGRVTVAAIDCVFAAPKSVSVLQALGSDEVSAVVRDAHGRAVQGALGYLERNAAFVRRGGSLVGATGLLTAAFLHRTSRAPDPHLHTHLLVANLGADDAGRWSAIDGRPIYAHAGVAGSLYRAGLRRAISDRLDISWERRIEGFADLLGIPKTALRGFSQRSDEIDAELREAHRSSRRSKEIAADRTRRAKQIDVSYEMLVRQWRERALDLSVARSTVTRLSTPARGARDNPRRSEAEMARAIEASIASFDRPFTRGELLRSTSARLVDGAPIDAVESAIDAELERAPLVRADEHVAFFGRARSGRFPSGIVEARYMTTEVAALVRERDDGLGALARPDPVLDAKTARAFERGGLVLPPTTAVYEFVRSAAKTAHEDGRRIVAFAASRVGAAHIEALTGIEPESWKTARTLPAGTFVVVDDPRFTPIPDTAELVEFTRSGRVAAVFLDRRANGVRVGHDPKLAGGGGPIERFDADGVRVVVAPDLAGLASETRRLAGFARASGREPIVVSARPVSIADVFGGTIEPARLWRKRDQDPRARVITVGAAPVLGRAIDEVPDGLRSHLVLSAIARHRGGRSAVLAIAEPRELRRTLGRFPLGFRERGQWTARCEERERARSLDIARPNQRTRDPRFVDRTREAGRGL